MMEIKRADTTVVTVHPDDSSVQVNRLMGENLVKLTFRVPSAALLQIGDTIEFDGLTYTLNALPTVNEVSSREYQYNCEFTGIDAELAKVGYKLFDETPTPLMGDFSLTGNAFAFVSLLVGNLNRIYTGFAVGDVLDSETKTLTFSGEDCLSVLQRLASEFDTEYYIGPDKSVNLRKKPYSGAVITLSYGMGNGLRSLTRQKRDDDPIITRLFACGSDKNLPSGYRNGAKRLMLPGDGYLLQNILLYGIREGDKIFDDIYPRLKAGEGADPGKLTAVTDKLTITDANLDFDLNDYLSDSAAKMVFTTGALAGYEFEIASFDDGSKTYKLIAQEYDGVMLPSDGLMPAVGDKYVLVDIYMPPAYVTAAELELSERALNYIDEYAEVREAYRAECDTLHFKNNNISLSIGQVVRIQSAPLGVDREIRIIGYTRNLNQPYQYDVELAEKPTKGKIEQLSNEISSTNQTVNHSQQVNYQTTLQLLELIKQLDRDTAFGEITGLPTDSAALKEYLDRIGNGSTVDTSSGYVSGAIIWQGGLTWKTVDLKYKILGVIYSCTDRTITAAAADANLPRIDQFVGDTFSNVELRAGAPAVNPQSPTVGVLELGFNLVYISPGALEPSNVDIERVYDEHTAEEWTATSSSDANITVNLDATDEPVNGSKCMKVSIAIPDEVVSYPVHYIGERYQGGKIFYLTPGTNGKKGYIAAEVDTAESVFWSRLSDYPSYTTGATGTAIGTGKTNTAKMLALAASAGQAARFANELVIDGFSDFFIPSRDEAVEMYKRRFEIGGLGTKDYWTSTELAWNKARAISMGRGSTFSNTKNNRCYLRAIREFDDTLLPTNQPVEAFTPQSTSITFEAPEELPVQDGIISMNIASDKAWRANSILMVEAYAGAVRIGSTALSPSIGLFGYRPDDPDWQTVAIQMFNLIPSRSTFDALKISLTGSWPNNNNLRLDDIRYQHSEIESDLMTPGTYGGSEKSLVVTYNAQGKATAAEEVPNVPANGTVSTAKIQDEAVTVDKLEPGVATAIAVGTLASFGVTIDGGSSAITTGEKTIISIPYNCTIKEWTLIADVQGSIVIDLWKSTFENYPPTVANTITGSDKPMLNNVIKNNSTALNGWNMEIAAGDIIRFNVDSCTAVKKAILVIKVQKH